MADPAFGVHETELIVEGTLLASEKHVRTQIREFMVLTFTGLPTTEGRVFDSRPEGIKYTEEELPCLNVITPDDVLDTKVTNPKGIQLRQVQAVVEIRTKANDSALIADQSSAEVQAALAADETLGGIAKESFLSDVTTSLSGEIESPTAVIRLGFSISYRINESDPTTPIN